MRRWLWLGSTSLVVLAAVALPFLLRRRVPDESGLARGVRAEYSYYVLLPAIEVASTRADGKEWDRGGTAPDVYYEIHWQGHRVFESSAKDDTFVARWSTASIGPRDVLKAVSIDDSIKAARITARPGEKIGFRVYDDDLAGDDLVASWEVAVESLQVGDHKWERPAGQLVSVVCRVLPFDAVELEALTR
jgi:hypothetical protein